MNAANWKIRKGASEKVAKLLKKKPIPFVTLALLSVTLVLLFYLKYILTFFPVKYSFYKQPVYKQLALVK